MQTHYHFLQSLRPQSRRTPRPSFLHHSPPTMLPAFVVPVSFVRPGARPFAERAAITTVVRHQQNRFVFGSRRLGSPFCRLSTAQPVRQLLKDLKSKRYQIRGTQRLDVHGSFPRIPKI